MNDQLQPLSTSDLATITGGFVSDLRNTRNAFNTGAFLGGMFAQHKTAQGLEPYVGPGAATIAGNAAGLVGSVIGGVGAGVIGAGADVVESVTGRPLR
jgi:hypothetical protein